MDFRYILGAIASFLLFFSMGHENIFDLNPIHSKTFIGFYIGAGIMFGLVILRAVVEILIFLILKNF